MEAFDPIWCATVQSRRNPSTLLSNTLAMTTPVERVIWRITEEDDVMVTWLFTPGEAGSDSRRRDSAPCGDGSARAPATAGAFAETQVCHSVDTRGSRPDRETPSRQTRARVPLRLQSSQRSGLRPPTLTSGRA